MRDIKFRMFDAEKNKMHYCDKILICDNGFFVENSNFDFNENHNDDDNAQIMQYTGLKDKNGVEIYEGDIIRFTPELGSYKCRPEECIVEYEKGLWNVSFFQSDFMEIIGNIHQNPELLA